MPRGKISGSLHIVNLVPGTLQEGGVAFGSTHWSVVLLAAQSESSEAAQVALTRFCESYWPPLYSFLRRQGCPPGDAQDFVQGFFAHLLAEQTLSRADRAKGRLRTFLIGALKHFLANERDRARAGKRGGGQATISMDEHPMIAEAAPCEDLEAAFYDQSWAANLMDRAWQQLQAAFAREGNERWLEAVKPLLVGGATTVPGQDEVACRLGQHPATLRTALRRLRQRYRDALRAEVAQTVASPDEIDEEMHYLYRVLVPGA